VSYRFPFIDNNAYQGGGIDTRYPRNLIFKPFHQGGKPALVLAPGLETLVDTGTGMEIRGMTTMDDNVYIVAGNRLFSMNDKTQLTEIDGDPILTETGLVTMDFNDALNNHHLVICDGTYSYCYKETTGLLTRLSSDDHDFMGGESVTFVNGRWVFNRIDSNRFFWSGLNDGLSHDAASFFGVQSPTGNIIRVLADKDEVIVFKKSGIAFFAVFTSDGNPYTHRPGSDMSVGLHARNAVARLDNTTYWLGEDLNVYRANGYSPVVISSHQITREFESYEITEDAIAYAYVFDGLPYFSLTFPTAGKSWVYDAANKRWFERSSYRKNKSSDGRYRGNCYTKFGHRHLIGDYENGLIYELSNAIFQENNNPIRFSNTCPIWDNNRDYQDLSEVEVVCEQGNADLSGQGKAPQMILRYSKDNGRTWSNELWREMGLRGQYGARVLWNRLGSARSWLIEISGSDPIKWVITDVYARPPE